MSFSNSEVFNFIDLRNKFELLASFNSTLVKYFAKSDRFTEFDDPKFNILGILKKWIMKLIKIYIRIGNE